MTARPALEWGGARLRSAGLPGGRREARLLLRAVGGPEAWLHPAAELPAAVLAAYRAAVERRAAREPFAYVVGRREFWKLELEVCRAVLVPRPETETLVERALARLAPGGRIADLCTGCGAVAVALASERAEATVAATDISAPALDVAARNVARHGLGGRVRLFCGDLWAALPPGTPGGFDLCTCNPPYVDAAELAGLEPEVRDWEPRVALVAPEGWRSLYGRVAAGAARWLRPGGWLCVEVGRGQAAEVARIFAACGLVGAGAHTDLAGIERVVEARRGE